MCKNMFVLGALAAFLVSWCGGCHGSSASSTDTASAPAATEPAAIPIPPGSPFAAIKMDMGMQQVTDLLGPPTDQENYMTGKAFNPFHNGDTYRLCYHYKGQGRIVFSNANRYSSDMRVSDIQYDPTESGYH